MPERRVIKLVAGIGAIVLLSVVASGCALVTPWTKLPAVPNLSDPTKAQFKEDVAYSITAGMRADRFAKAGDSNSTHEYNFTGLGCEIPDWGTHPNLANVVERYKRSSIGGLDANCAEANSFSRKSAATAVGAYSIWLTSPGGGRKPFNIRPANSECGIDETPIACEVRLVRPRFTFVMTGTNDLAWAPFLRGYTYQQRYEQVICEVRKAGSVPVMVTLPPRRGPAPPGQADFPEVDYRNINGYDLRHIALDLWVAQMNEAMVAVAEREGVAVVNLWRALRSDKTRNWGLLGDNLHLSVKGGVESPSAPKAIRNAVDLSPEGLEYGANLRHLIHLQSLRALNAIADTVDPSEAPSRLTRADDDCRQLTTP